MAEIVCYVSRVCYVNFDLFRFNQLNAIGAKFGIHFKIHRAGLHFSKIFNEINY